MALFRYAINPPWTELPHCSALLHGFPRDYSVHEYRTTLSIKTVLRGEAWYETASGRYRVTPDVFLILNHGQRYSMEVEASAQTETLCPFFQAGLVENAIAAPNLDDPAASMNVEFCERLYSMDGPVGRALVSMAAKTVDEEAFHDLVGALLLTHEGVGREIERFPGRRATTRAETYRRLHRGLDFLFSSLREPVTVADAAHAASMAPFHFHHSFKRAFGRTPMQMLQAYRLHNAREAILAGADVTDACLSSGFESITTFSGLFKRRFGLSPGSLKRGRAGIPREA